jgi:hypothetical protein
MASGKGSSASRKQAGPPEARPELVVVLDPAAAVEVRAGQVVPADPTGRALLAPLADSPPGSVAADRARIRPLFSPVPGRIAAGLPPETADRLVSPLDRYFVVDGVVSGHAELRERLSALDGVVGAYVKPAAELPALDDPAALNDMAPLAEDPPAVTPDLTGRQGYLGPPPGGVDAHWAWTQPGGRGEGVNVVDVEGAWRFSHEDLVQHQAGVIAGTQSDLAGWRNHGTAVCGVIGSDENGFGTTGIAPDASQRAVVIFGDGMGSAAAIRIAADALSPGDILLIELHRPGPLSGAVGQRGYIAVEWWPDDYDAVVYAVGRGVIVVAAAGNGTQDLDDPAYDTPQEGFPPSWSNPFRRGARDSGAILVGAGAPPPGTHGTGWGADRSRLDFSNHGSAVDVQGWGREVTTCGYGDLQGGLGSEDYWYTDGFSGTSSASPIVVGALACTQGVLRAAGATPLTPQSARTYLHETGSPQQADADAPLDQRIGTRPDVRALVARARGEQGGDGGDGDHGGDGEEQDGDGKKTFAKLEKNEFKEMLEHGRPQQGPGPTLEGRLSAVESAVAELRHFITTELRPDVSAGARRGTGDREGEKPGGQGR